MSQTDREAGDEEGREQCAAMSPVPLFYKGSVQYGLCMKRKGHDGNHQASPAYDSVQWETKEGK